ncbi:MAG TPA: fumarylacetoacetate hydrolase family protein [Candidatus Limnocylindrales bacterium]
MTVGLFRLELPDGSVRLARGAVESGPARLLAANLTVETILRRGRDGLASALRAGGDDTEVPAELMVPGGFRVLAPVDAQEVWAAGVTYARSRDARMAESADASPYDRVYAAERPELFFKAAAWRVRGPSQTVGIRADSGWDVPEPELALVVSSDGAIAGYTLGNDVSSRTIEGENPLYLPQAKSYDGSCALGPALVSYDAASPPFDLHLLVIRDGATIVDETTSTSRIRRPLEDLVAYLMRALDLPSGAILLTGTGIVPQPDFTLVPGDLVRIDGGPLGVLENTVVRVGRTGEARTAGAQAVSGLDGSPSP